MFLSDDIIAHEIALIIDIIDSHGTLIIHTYIDDSDNTPMAANPKNMKL